MRILNDDDIRAAVIGGTILGGGGGGHIEAGLSMGAQALASGEVRLVDVDELPADTWVAICAGVGAPGAPEAHLIDEHFGTSLAHLNAELARRDAAPVGAVATNENGAVGTVNGWLQAAVTGLPLVDNPCNGRAHPTAIMGSLGLHRDPSYTSVAGFAGGPQGKYCEGVVVGSLETTSQAMRSLSIVAGGLVAVARNPVRLDFLAERGAPGGITQAIAVGRAHASGGADAVAAALGGRIVGRGGVEALQIEQRSGFDVGRLRAGGVELTFVNEYMDAAVEGESLAHFPDLIMTFDVESGEPVVSAHLQEGRPVDVLVAPRSSLLLSATMDMAELMEPIAVLLSGGTVNAG